MKEREAQKRQREGLEKVDQDPSVGRRSKINWHESKLLIKYQSPEEPIDFDDVAEYLDQVEEYARAVLNDLSLDPESKTLCIDAHRLTFDNEYFEESADSSVALRLFEHATSMKGLLKIDAPNRQQVNLMLCKMAQISALTSMPHLGSVKIKQGKAAEKHRADRLRNGEIRRLRAQGEKVSVLAEQFGLKERRIKRIISNKK